MKEVKKMTNENEKIIDIMTGAKTAVVSCDDSYILGLIKETIKNLTNANIQYINNVYHKIVVIDSKALELDSVDGDVVLYGIICTAYAHGYKADINGYYGYSFQKAVHLLIGEDD